MISGGIESENNYFHTAPNHQNTHFTLGHPHCSPIGSSRGKGGVVNSVLQDWVMVLPRREQGTLLTCVRGCDLTPKMPLDSTERRLVSALRYAFMRPYDIREVDFEPGSFFSSEPPHPSTWKASSLGHYPLHWFSHIMHSSEILGYRHPDIKIAFLWECIYIKLAESLHLRPETKDAMIARLSEDRIVNGSVVS